MGIGCHSAAGVAAAETAARAIQIAQEVSEARALLVICNLVMKMEIWACASVRMQRAFL
jgi:hypothetical protein